MGRLSAERDGEAVGEGTGPWWLAFFWSSFSLAEPGGGGSRRLEGSSTGIRLCLRLRSLRGVAVEEEAGPLVSSGAWLPSTLSSPTWARCWGSVTQLGERESFSESFSLGKASLLPSTWPLTGGER